MDGIDGSKWDHTGASSDSKERSEDVGGSHELPSGTYDKRWEETGAGGQMCRSVGVGGEGGRWRSSRTRKNMDDDIRYCILYHQECQAQNQDHPSCLVL